jgi:leader peptidase (prepilin peptidase)/N-methyltransferase
MLLAGKRIANTDLHEVHGDDPDLGEEDPDAGLAKSAVPFGPFLALAALEFALVPDQIQAVLGRIWEWMIAV